MVSPDDIRLVLTCGSCPEQYDAFLGDRQVGYLRLRWGEFTVAYPDVGGEAIFAATVGFGNFDDDDQRATYLTLAKEAIAAKIDGKRQVTLWVNDAQLDAIKQLMRE